MTLLLRFASIAYDFALYAKIVLRRACTYSACPPYKFTLFGSSGKLNILILGIQLLQNAQLQPTYYYLCSVF